MESKNGTIPCVRPYWKIIADNLSKRGWSWGYISAVDSQGRTIWIVDAHRDDGKRYVVRANEKLTPFMELESAIQAFEGATIFTRSGPKVSDISWRVLPE